MSMKISEVLHALNACDPEAKVQFDFCGCTPTTVDSWRGVYAEPALGWEYSDTAEPKVKDLIAEIEKAIGDREYTGWKGGQYSYDENDTLHIDNPGKWTSTEIARIENCEWFVVLHTEVAP